MRALVVGYGSIGKRHVSNLAMMDRIEKIVIVTGQKVADRHSPGEKLEFVPSVSDALAAVPSDPAFDFAVVCNDTSRHMETAILLAGKGINMLVEKPLSHSLEGLGLLNEIVEERAIKVAVGYNMRFLGALTAVKEELERNTFGKCCFARIEVGQYLPSWRAGRDYRESYSASRERGGGVDRDLSHEIDYMRFLFGDPDEWKVMKARTGMLDLDAPDVFEGIYRFPNDFMCSVHMDYLCPDSKREMRLVGSSGIAACDFIKKIIRIETNNGTVKTITDEALFDMNRTYVDELSRFMQSVAEDKQPAVTIDDGARVLELIEEQDVPGS
jgi:predicted dehydrogenase